MNRLTFRSLIAALGLIVLLSLPSVASADGVTVKWTFSGVSFDDGGMASGSFDYNALNNVYSAINITTTAGSAITGTTTYTSLSGTFQSNSFGLILGVASGDTTNTPLLFLMFGSPFLTDAGTPVSLTGVGEGTCGSNCMVDNTLLRSITGGELSGTPISIPVPEPSAVLLLGLGLVALMAGAAIYKVSLA
jgi:hypothetical protein